MTKLAISVQTSEQEPFKNISGYSGNAEVLSFRPFRRSDFISHTDSPPPTPPHTRTRTHTSALYSTGALYYGPAISHLNRNEEKHLRPNQKEVKSAWTCFKHRSDSSSQPITFPLSRGSSSMLTQCTSKKTKWKHKKVKIYTSWWNNLGLKRIKNKLRHAKDTNLEIWILFCGLQSNIFDHSRISSQEETPNLRNPQSKGSCLNKTQTHWNIMERHQFEGPIFTSGFKRPYLHTCSCSFSSKVADREQNTGQQQEFLKIRK